MPGNNKSYSIIATYYDKMMNHVDYEMWARYLQAIFKHLQIKPRRIVDLSCGTGSLLVHLNKKGRCLYGSDLSREMVQIANAKTSLPLTCADLKNLPYQKFAFDVALVMYDAMNYIIENNDIETIFNEIELILKPGGWFIFDIVTPYICEKDFRDYFESDIKNDRGYERRSWFISEGNKQFNEFTVWHGKERQTELHEQNIRSLDEWHDCIAHSSFEIVDWLGDFSFHKGHDKSDRIHFICRKKFK